MKTLLAYGDELKAERIVKTESEVIGHVGERIAFRFAGITDFTSLSLVEGEEWDVLPTSIEERQEASESAILSLMDMSLMGGI